MKHMFSLFAVILLTASILSAGETSCPADRASEIGFDPFGDFHHLMAPVWHTAWAEKDYETLLAAGPKFKELFKPIAEMTPQLKSEKRLEIFNKNRTEFGKTVALFADACAIGDKEKAYEIMPHLHDTFEMTASALLPLHYPEFDGFVISFNLLNENHIPTNNIDGIKGTVETLTAKVNGLNEETIPEELLDEKTSIMEDFAKIQKMVGILQECCDKNDMEKLKKEAGELSVVIDTFVQKYI